MPKTGKEKKSAKDDNYVSNSLQFLGILNISAYLPSTYPQLWTDFAENLKARLLRKCLQPGCFGWIRVLIAASTHNS